MVAAVVAAVAPLALEQPAVTVETAHKALSSLLTSQYFRLGKRLRQK
jgi:hypothetical protein